MTILSKFGPPQCSFIVIESSFDPGERLQAPGSLWFDKMQNFGSNLIFLKNKIVRECVRMMNASVYYYYILHMMWFSYNFID
jgi:hypothetical protein